MSTNAPASEITSNKKVIGDGNPDGCSLGGATTDKISFYGVTTIVQRSGAAQTAVATTVPTSTNPYGFSTSTQANAIVTLVNELRAALVASGLIKGSA